MLSSVWPNLIMQYMDGPYLILMVEEKWLNQKWFKPTPLFLVCWVAVTGRPVKSSGCEIIFNPEMPVKSGGFGTAVVQGMEMSGMAVKLN